jgi:hypothetical protein
MESKILTVGVNITYSGVSDNVEIQTQVDLNENVYMLVHELTSFVTPPYH